MESLKNKASNAPSTSDLFVIEVNNFSHDKLWVLDTSCGSHICTDIYGLRNSRKLNKGESNPHLGNGARVAALAIGTYVLTLPNRLVLHLDDCFNVLALTKNIFFVSYLNRKGFHLTFINNSCSIMLNGVLYASGRLCNGIYILDMTDPILTIHDNKRQRQDNWKSSYLWHCRLFHISEKCMSKLHKDRSLGSFDYESYDLCESCLLGKMRRLLSKGRGQRASGPLGLIQTNVCGPISTHARGGFIYFITFIDDYSQYRYLYLVRYKYEAFEKFKELKNEVKK